MTRVLSASTLNLFSGLEKIQGDGIGGLYSKLLLFSGDDFMAFEWQC